MLPMRWALPLPAAALGRAVWRVSVVAAPLACVLKLVARLLWWRRGRVEAAVGC